MFPVKRRREQDHENPYTSKKGHGKDFLSLERQNPHLEAPKDYLKDRLDNWYEAKRMEIMETPGVSNIQKQSMLIALDFDYFKEEKTSINNEENEEFVKDFIKWLRYEDPDNRSDPRYVRDKEAELGKYGATVRKGPLNLMGQKDWLNTFVYKKDALKRKLATLYGGPNRYHNWHLYHGWLFYKYILRGVKGEDEKSFLSDIQNLYNFEKRLEEPASKRPSGYEHSNPLAKLEKYPFKDEPKIKSDIKRDDDDDFSEPDDNDDDDDDRGKNDNQAVVDKLDDVIKAVQDQNKKADKAMTQAIQQLTAAVQAMVPPPAASEPQQQQPEPAQQAAAPEPEADDDSYSPISQVVPPEPLSPDVKRVQTEPEPAQQGAPATLPQTLANTYTKHISTANTPKGKKKMSVTFLTQLENAMENTPESERVLDADTLKIIEEAKKHLKGKKNVPATPVLDRLRPSPEPTSIYTPDSTQKHSKKGTKHRTRDTQA